MQSLPSCVTTASSDKIFAYENFNMNVVIDHREPNQFQRLFGAEDTVSTAQLKCGDFLNDDPWVFERKTIRDLCVSRVDGRLFRQAVCGGPAIGRKAGKPGSSACCRAFHALAKSGPGPF
jgi:hypothetical protein